MNLVIAEEIMVMRILVVIFIRTVCELSCDVEF